MSTDVPPTTAVPQDATPPVDATSTQAVSGSVTGDTLISTMGDLQALAPPLYQAIQMAIFMEIKREQDNANANIKQHLQDAEQ